MKLLKEISITNFKCFRKKTKISLNQSSYLVGKNNSGKSAVLTAIRCFFDDDIYEFNFLNRTEYTSKRKSSNKTQIELKFDLNFIIKSPTKKKYLTKKFGKTLSVTKNFVFKETSKQTDITYTISKKTYSYLDLDPNLIFILDRISVSYIHPQDAQSLLLEAQEKLKNRLLSNWGRNLSMSASLNDLKDSWEKLRTSSNLNLSKALSDNIQSIWPGAKLSVNLPESIDEIIAISDISFQKDASSPFINLTSQGTGAQSTILYQTHFLLDSDKTLHRGFYYPIWLLEEPESFLHVDILIKLANDLSSKLWMDNIQMLISTHSPMLLAASRIAESNTNWILVDEHVVKKQSKVDEWNEEEIKEIGTLMGDSNFDVYFYSAGIENAVYLEDIRTLTATRFKEQGIEITRQLNGSSDVRKYFEVLINLNISKGNKNYFILDDDKGAQNMKKHLTQENLLKNENGIRLYSFNDESVNVILLEENKAIEDYFDEFDQFLEDTVAIIFEPDFKPSKSAIPPNLTRTHGTIRNKKVNSLEEAKLEISKTQDAKDIFWIKVDTENLKLNSHMMETIKSLMK